MYDSKTYKVSEDAEVMKIIDTNELSPYSVTTYQSVIKQFTNCIGKSYSEIVKEIKEQEGDEIIDNKIIRYNPNDSIINDYILKYKNFLETKGNKKSTVNLKIRQLLLLLRKSNIQTPKIKFHAEKKQSKVQLITTDDIRFILNNCNIHHKALISFMASTGMRRYDVVHLKIEDFIDACSDYTDAVFLDDFLETATEDMIPYFEFIPHKTQKTGLACKVCCSTEASNFILQSIKARIKSIKRHNREHKTDLRLTEESPLFASKVTSYLGEYNIASITVMFHTKNKLLREHNEKELDKLLKNHKISKKEWRVRKENLPKFHPHGLRHRFISTVRAYTTNRDVSLLMEGHASSISTDKFYIGESEELFNKDSVKETYLQVMPYLTFFQQLDPISYIQEKEETIKLKNKINQLEQKINDFEQMNEYIKNNSVLKDVI